MSSWHPDFRNPERLPDTKVIRTTFFINGIPIVVALLAGLWFASNELHLRDLNRQINELQAEIDQNRPASTRGIALFKEFQAEGARIGEVEAFIKSRPQVSVLLMHLADTLPANIAVDGFGLTDKFLTLRGTVRGAPDQASGYASSYVQFLQADALMAGTFDEIKLVNLGRNPATGRLNLEISMRIRVAPAAPAKKS